MNVLIRCAAYARYSTDRQNPPCRPKISLRNAVSTLLLVAGSFWTRTFTQMRKSPARRWTGPVYAYCSPTQSRNLGHSTYCFSKTRVACRESKPTC